MVRDPAVYTGTQVMLIDGDLDFPDGIAQGFRFTRDGSEIRKTFCKPPAGEARSSREDASSAYRDDEIGVLAITRLPDDEDAANAYSGKDFLADDWARMDVRIWRIGDCS